MHVKAKAIAFGGLALALSIVFMALGSVIESNTLFVLAAASYFVGIVVREFGLKTGAAFYVAAVLLGLLIAPNKFYVISYGAMGLYILVVETVWKVMSGGSVKFQRRWIFWVVKYFVFNLLFIPALFFFQDFFFSQSLSSAAVLGIVAGGQFGLWIYDQAYEYVQRHLWGKYRRYFFMS